VPLAAEIVHQIKEPAERLVLIGIPTPQHRRPSHRPLGKLKFRGYPGLKRIEFLNPSQNPATSGQGALIADQERL
jgi:hypothetical protein